jgi:hypothetical protein
VLTVAHFLIKTRILLRIDLYLQISSLSLANSMSSITLQPETLASEQMAERLMRRPDINYALNVTLIDRVCLSLYF